MLCVRDLTVVRGRSIKKAPVLEISIFELLEPMWTSKQRESDLLVRFFEDWSGRRGTEECTCFARLMSRGWGLQGRGIQSRTPCGKGPLGSPHVRATPEPEQRGDREEIPSDAGGWGGANRQRKGVIGGGQTSRPVPSSWSSP